MGLVGDIIGGLLQPAIDIVLLIALAAMVILAKDAVGKHSPTPYIIAAVGAAALLVASLSAIIVPAGSIAVVTTFGAVQGDTLPPGLHFRLPFANQAHIITTRVQAHPFEEIEAASLEYQAVKLTGVMNYHLDGSQASDLYQRVGDDFASKVLDPAFKDYIKQIVPDYRIGDILNKRDEIRQRAKVALQANLLQYHIVVDDIYIANIGFGEAYTAAIEAKQVAQQQVETERQVLAQRQIQAQQAVAIAQGQADAIVVRAKGDAEGNRQLSESLTDRIIQYLYITRINPNIQVALVPTDGNLLINPADLLPKPSTTP